MKQRMVSHAATDRLVEALARLGGLDGEALKEHWRTLYDTEPPARISASLLVQAVAYKLQEKTLGGLKPSIRRTLERVAGEVAAGRPTVSAPARKLKAGTVLIREWRGATHQVTVLEDGVRFGGARYRSLSQVAREITGSRWSGPLFFGLKSAGKERAHGAH